MKKALRYLLIIIAILLVAVGGFAAFVAIRGIPSYKAETVSFKVSGSPERIERGRQLSAMLCNDCHMDRNTDKLTGRKMDEVKQFGAVYSKNITKDPEHGIGKWTDGELAYLLRTGIKPDGTVKLMDTQSSVSCLIFFTCREWKWIIISKLRKARAQR